MAPSSRASRPIKNGQVEFVIPDVPYGTYAIIVGHDVNRDGKIDENPFSAELKGISNYTSKILWFPELRQGEVPGQQGVGSHRDPRLLGAGRRRPGDA